MTSIYRGDDTGAFDGKFLQINLNNLSEKVITKAEFRCGAIFKVFENPLFPIDINLTSEETLKLQDENSAFLAIYDEQGRKKTIMSDIVFKTKGRVV